MSDLEQQLEEFGAAALRVADERNEYSRRARAAEARVKMLEEALAPFAVVAEWLRADLPDHFDAGEVATFTLGDCRRARAALAKEEGGK